jgi:hypothetical protein
MSTIQKKNTGPINRKGETIKRMRRRGYTPSTSMPFGTNGTEPVAMIIFFAVTTLSDPTFTF